MQRNMMCRTLAGLAGMIVFTVNLCGAEYDFTKGTLPRGVIGTDRQLLKDRRLDNYLPQFRIVVDEDVKNKDTFTISVWFAPNKRIRNSAPEALVFGKTPFAPENNLGFFFGLNKTRLEFKWGIISHANIMESAPEETIFRKRIKFLLLRTAGIGLLR